MSSVELAAARLLLDRLGISPEQLLGTPASSPARPVPTFQDYIDQLADAVPPATRRAYGPYWRRIANEWGDRLIDNLTPSEINRLVERVKGDVVVRRNSRGGRSAAEHLISALRCLYRHAVADGLLTSQENPATQVAKPRRLGSTRRALPVAGLTEILEVVGRTGNDPDLDLLILRLHIETACRRGGALALQTIDLDHAQCVIRLREKGDTQRWQPVSPTLMQGLITHHAERAVDSSEQLLVYRNGRPITARRYDHLWKRIGTQLPWVSAQQVSTHWLRHTTLTWVERNFGYAVARAYAGHAGRNDAGTTTTYVRADIDEVAFALAALTGEPHPLAKCHDSGASAVQGRSRSNFARNPAPSVGRDQRG